MSTDVRTTSAITAVSLIYPPIRLLIRKYGMTPMGTLIEISASAVKMCRLYFPAYFKIDDI